MCGKRGRPVNQENEKLRQAARERGDKVYDSIQPCKHGHIARLVSDNRCHACKLQKAKRYRDAMNLEKKEKQMAHVRAYMKKRYNSDPDFRRYQIVNSEINRHLRALNKLLDME